MIKIHLRCLQYSKFYWHYIAQLDSQGKLTTPRRENQKNFTRQLNFKGKRTRFVCVVTSDLSIDSIKHTCKSRETIPLNAPVSATTIKKNNCEANFVLDNIRIFSRIS
jgi:hypothetical protein